MKRWVRALAAIAAARIVASAVLAAAPASDTMPAAQQNALVRKYCAVCHTDAARNGGLTLEHFDAAHVDPSLAAMLVSKLMGGAISASGLEKPDKSTIQALISSLTAESAGAREWTVTPPLDAATNQPILTASILRDLTAARVATGPALYRLVLTCNVATRLGEMQLSWSPEAKTGVLSASFDGAGSIAYKAEGEEKMGNGTPGNAGPASVMLSASPNVKLPARTLTISDLFPGETIVFPFDQLPQQTRQALSVCFAGH